MEEIRRRSDGSVDCEFYVRQARERRSAYAREALSLRSLAPHSPKAKGMLSIFGAAFVVATGAFWATMLVSPPITEAANPEFSISELQRRAPLDLPIGVSDAH